MNVLASAVIRLSYAAGVELPAPIRDAAAGIERLRAARAEQRRLVPGQPTRDLRSAALPLAEQALRGEEPDVDAAYEEVERRYSIAYKADERLRMMSHSIDIGEDLLVDVISEHATALLGAMAKALAEIVTTVQGVAAEVSSLNLAHPETVLTNATDAGIAAFRVLQAAAVRYRDLRSLQHQLRVNSVIRGGSAGFDEFRSGNAGGLSRHATERLFQLVTQRADVWLPSGDEAAAAEQQQQKEAQPRTAHRVAVRLQ